MTNNLTLKLGIRYEPSGDTTAADANFAQLIDVASSTPIRPSRRTVDKPGLPSLKHATNPNIENRSAS